MILYLHTLRSRELLAVFRRTTAPCLEIVEGRVPRETLGGTWWYMTLRDFTILAGVERLCQRSRMERKVVIAALQLRKR